MSIDRGECHRSSGHSRRAELGTGDLPPFFEEPVHRGTDSGIRIVVGLFWAAVARHRAGSSATVFFACAPSWLPSGLRLSSQRGGFWWRTISGERRVESFPLQLLAGSALCQTLPFLSSPSFHFSSLLSCPFPPQRLFEAVFRGFSHKSVIRQSLPNHPSPSDSGIFLHRQRTGVSTPSGPQEALFPRRQLLCLLMLTNKLCKSGSSL